MTPTDYAPWGGSLAFDSGANFYVDDDISTLESFDGQYDFYTVAFGKRRVVYCRER